MDPAADEPGSSAAVLGEVLEALIQRYGGEGHQDEVVRARGEFEARRGRVYEDEELWERWTQAFLEWYVVERVPPDDDLPPAARAVSGEGEARRAAAARAWVTSHRSLFEVKALRSGRVELVDILGGGAFSVAEKRRLHGVAVGDLVEARLVGFEDDVYFGQTFCFHAGETKEAILNHARSIYDRGGDRRDVLDHCASLRVRCEHYRHVEPARIYERATGTFPSPGRESVS